MSTSRASYHVLTTSAAQRLARTRTHPGDSAVVLLLGQDLLLLGRDLHLLLVLLLDLLLLYLLLLWLLLLLLAVLR
jgi:hypothetical protein